MILKTLSDSELSSGIKRLVATERGILTEILHHLLEIEERKLHLMEGYASMFQYAVQALGYSEAQAYRRISAMRLLKEIPEIELPLKAGSLNLTHLTQAREYFKSESKKSAPLSKNEKLELLYSLENKTTRETEKVFAVLDPDKVKPDQERQINEDQTEVRFVASNALIEKLNQFKALDSHVNANPTYQELFERLVDLALKQKAKQRAEQKTNQKTERKTARKTARKTKKKGDQNTDRKNLPKFSAPKKSASETEAKTKTEAQVCVGTEASELNLVTKRSRSIPVAVKRTILKRDQASCTFKNPITGRTCGSKFKLQFDHIQPFAKNGDHSTENIRVLCQNHNLLMAEKEFGREKIRSYH